MSEFSDNLPHTRKISAETSRDGPAVLRSQGAGADIRLVSETR